MGGYSLIKLNKSALSSDSGICELFSAGIKNEKQFSSVTLLSDERFALIEDKTTKFVDLVRIKLRLCELSSGWNVFNDSFCLNLSDTILLNVNS